MVNSDSTTPNQISKWALVLGLVVALIAFSFIGIYTSQAAADPYSREVLTLVGDEAQGNAIFQINCAGCHGSEANGNVGPNLHSVTQRKSDSRLIQQVISGNTPPMPKFQPAPQEMADLLSYLHTL